MALSTHLTSLFSHGTTMWIRVVSLRKNLIPLKPFNRLMVSL